MTVVERLVAFLRTTESDEGVEWLLGSAAAIGIQDPDGVPSVLGQQLESEGFAALNHLRKTRQSGGTDLEALVAVFLRSFLQGYAFREAELQRALETEQV